MSIRHVAIEGCIGVGKTTIARVLAAKLSTEFIGEAAELNPFLANFYSNPQKYALETELAFLLIHYHQFAHCVQAPIISDFTIGKDLVFAKINLRENDLRSFQALFNELTDRLHLPDMVVFLKLPIDACLRRIRSRGIPSEANIGIDYLAALEEAYKRDLSILGKDHCLLDIQESNTPDEIAQIICDRLQGAETADRSNLQRRH